MEDFVKTYIMLRDKRDAIKERHKEELASINQALDEAEGTLLRYMQDNKLEGIKTESGTVFKKQWTSVKVVDFDALMQYVIESGRYDLLEKRVSKTVALEIGNVAGTTTESGIDVGIRRS